MIAEDFLDRHCLELVIVRSRSAVSVYITYIACRNVCIFDRLLHYTDRAGTSLIWHGYMKCVAAHSVAYDLGKDPGPPSLSKLKFLEYQDAGALTDNKAVALGIERSRCSFRIVISRRKSSHRCESCDRHRRNSAFGSAAYHRVRIAALDHPKAVADRVSPRRTGS